VASFLLKYEKSAATFLKMQLTKTNPATATLRFNGGVKMGQ